VGAAVAGETLEQENRRLRREVTTLRQKQAFVKKWRTSRKSRVEVRRDRSPSGRVSCATHVPCARGLHRRRVVTTDSKRADPIAPNRLARQFDVHGVAINQVWVGDITYIPTREGFLDLATVLDLGSRRCVGWAMRNTMEVELVTSALQMAREARQLKWKPLLHTATSDNGKEFADHQNIARSLKLDFFFAKPCHSRERGSNEDLNRLIRQYNHPKQTDFDTLSDEFIQYVHDQINSRPGKRFNFDSFNNVFEQLTR